MERALVAAAIVVAVAAIALVVRSRRTVDAPTQRRYRVPDQLDRTDFERPEAPWLVAVFTSETCEACSSVLDRAKVLVSSEVAVAEVEFTAARDLHGKYGIDAVPTVVVCDRLGVAHASFLGPVNATDLWAAVAEAREPGSSPEPHLGQAPSATEPDPEPEPESAPESAPAPASASAPDPDPDPDPDPPAPPPGSSAGPESGG